MERSEDQRVEYVSERAAGRPGDQDRGTSDAVL